MFHSDISFTSKEKAVQFGEDAKNFLMSYKDALNYVREKATQDSLKDEYLENSKRLISGLKKNTLTFSGYLGQSMRNFTLIPTFNKDDEKFKLAKFTYLVFKENFKDLGSSQNFEQINKKFDEVYDLLEKQSNL